MVLKDIKSAPLLDCDAAGLQGRTANADGAGAKSAFVGALRLLAMTGILTVGFGLPAEAETANLIDIEQLDSQIRVDLKYATADNFMDEILYTDDRCFLRPETAKRLVMARTILESDGYGLVVYDCYRPLSIQKKMFNRFPQPGYVADPKKGSNHNRGAAVDVGLLDAEGFGVEMFTEYDTFSLKSHHDYYEKGKPEEARHREILKDAMVRSGFEPLQTEWWHYNDPDARLYPLLDIPIEEIQ